MKSELINGVIVLLVLSLAIVGFWNTLEQGWRMIRSYRRKRFLKKKLDSLYHGGEILERYKDYRQCGMTIVMCPNGCCVTPMKLFEETVKFKDPKGRVRTAKRVIPEGHPEYDGPKSTS